MCAINLYYFNKIAWIYWVSFAPAHLTTSRVLPRTKTPQAEIIKKFPLAVVKFGLSSLLDSMFKLARCFICARSCFTNRTPMLCCLSVALNYFRFNPSFKGIADSRIRRIHSQSHSHTSSALKLNPSMCLPGAPTSHELESLMNHIASQSINLWLWKMEILIAPWNPLHDSWATCSTTSWVMEVNFQCTFVSSKRKGFTRVMEN